MTTTAAAAACNVEVSQEEPNRPTVTPVNVEGITLEKIGIRYRSWAGYMGVIKESRLGLNSDMMNMTTVELTLVVSIGIGKV